MKRIIALLLFFISFANADYMLYVNSPEEVDSMFAVLNAVAKIFQNDSYLDLLRLMVLFGSFTVFFSWVIGTFHHGEAHSGGSNFTKYHIGIVALLMIAFSAKTTVWVKSENFPQYYENSSVTTGIAVDNIPEVAAYSMHFLNSFGRSLQNMYEVAMSPVGSYSLADGGYASSLRDDLQLLSMKLGDSDGTLGKAMDTVVSQCIFIPFSAKGNEGAERIEELKRSNNIKNTIDNWYSNGVEVGGIKASEYQATYNGETWKCGALWSYIKDSLLPAYHEKAGKYLSRLDSRDLELITGMKNVPKSDFDEIAIQAGIVNSVLDNKDLPAGVTYASGKTQAEFVQQNTSAGYYMSKMLPIMQSLFRVIIYALLPAIIAIALLPGGWNILKNYAKTAVWIELWGVIASILNFFILKYTEHNIAGEITAYSASTMLSETSAMAGMAGYLYLMVPAIAWGVMSGSFTMLQGLASGVAAGMSKNVSTATTAADSQAMKMKEAISEKMGKSLSYAEALHFENNIKGIERGVSAGVKMEMGNTAIKSLADLQTRKQYVDMEEKFKAAKALGYAPTAEGVANLEGKVSSGSLSKSIGDLEESGFNYNNMYRRGAKGAATEMGQLATSTIKDFYNAGKKSGRETVAMSEIEQKHGDAIRRASFNKQNEDILRTNERIDTLNEEVGNVDSFFVTDTKQNVKTQEVPSFFRNDRNGDGKVSDSEIDFEKNINVVEAKKGVIDKYTQQQQLAQNAEMNRTSGSATVRNVQAQGEALVAGLDDRTKAIIGASATKTAIGTKVENANQAKDSKVLEQLDENGKRMEDTAVLDSKRMLGDLAQTKTQTDTTGQLIKDLTGKKSEIREKVSEMTSGDYYKTDKILMTSMAKVGIADGKLTQRNLQRDTQKVQAETQQKLQQGLTKAVGERDLGTLNAYNTLLQNRENIAQRLEHTKDSKERDELQRALEQYDNIVLPTFENSRDMQVIKSKVEEYQNSSEAQQIISQGQKKLEKVYQSYEQMGLIKRDSNGQIQVADTAKTIDALQGEQKALYVEKVKRSLDGLKTSTIGLDGMQLERVDNIIGEHVTERATATQEWSKTGRFNNDIQYHAVTGDYIKPENLATINTGTNTFKELVSWWGVGKFIKGGHK